MRRSIRKLTLNDLAVDYTGPRSDLRPRKVGGLNPFGFALWSGVEGNVLVFTLKRGIVIGGLRLHALRVRGLRDPRKRSELLGGPGKGVEPTVAYALRCLGLLKGVPFPGIGKPLKLTRDDFDRNIPAGAFRLIERRR